MNSHYLKNIIISYLTTNDASVSINEFDEFRFKLTYLELYLKQ